MEKLIYVISLLFTIFFALSSCGKDEQPDTNKFNKANFDVQVVEVQQISYLVMINFTVTNKSATAYTLPGNGTLVGCKIRFTITTTDGSQYQLLDYPLPAIAANSTVSLANNIQIANKTYQSISYEIID
jgi:hypothetical protein